MSGLMLPPGEMAVLVHVAIPQGMDFEAAKGTKWAKKLAKLTMFTKNAPPLLLSKLDTDTEEVNCLMLLGQANDQYAPIDVETAEHLTGLFYEQWDKRLADWTHEFDELAVIVQMVYSVPYEAVETMGQPVWDALAEMVEHFDLLLEHPEPNLN